MGWRVKEEGGSEGRPVMGRIGAELAPRETGLTSLWSRGTRKSGQPLWEAEQMTAAARLAGAASPGNRKRVQVRIVQVRRQDRRRLRPAQIGGALARLKLHASKGARAVSRGGGGGNATSLPDPSGGE